VADILAQIKAKIANRVGNLFGALSDINIARGDKLPPAVKENNKRKKEPTIDLLTYMDCIYFDALSVIAEFNARHQHVEGAFITVPASKKGKLGHEDLGDVLVSFRQVCLRILQFGFWVLVCS
jgi:hypothetical protein